MVVEAGELVASMETASRSTYFSRLRELEQHSVLIRETLSPMPRRRRYCLPSAGRDLLRVADDVERWLMNAGKPVPLDTSGAGAAIKALLTGWNMEILHRLAERPTSLGELDAGIQAFRYHHLRHALRGLSSAGLVRQVSIEYKRRPFCLTPFGRLTAAALGSAVRWEEKHFAASTTALKPLDSQALLLLPAPMIELDTALSGTCALHVEKLAVVSLEVAAGRVVNYAAGVNGGSNGEVRGSRGDWRDAVTAKDLSGLEIRGDHRLAAAVVEALMLRLS
jgi:DNA-binding HxlR family transcriptional regulator